MTKLPVRVALLGAGAISEEHADALRLIPEVQTVAVCDLSHKRAQELAERFKIPSVYANLEQMVERERPDVIHVLTPPQTHTHLALECIELGCNVYVEKPFGLSVAACEKVKQASEGRGLVAGVNHNLLFRPAIQETVRLIQNCRIGKLHHVGVSYVLPESSVPLKDAAQFMFQDPLNMLFEVGPHPLSVIRKLMGRLRTLEAIPGGDRIAAGNQMFHSSWQIIATAERGTAQLFLSMGNGSRDITVSAYGQDGTIHADVVRNAVKLVEWPDRRIYGDLFQAVGNAKELIRGTSMPLRSRIRKGMGWGAYPSLHSMLGSIRSFYECLIKGKPLLEGAAEAVQVIEYCEAGRITAQSRNGRGGLQGGGEDGAYGSSSDLRRGGLYRPAFSVSH